MWEGVITTRVEVPRWTQREIAAVNAAEHVAIWRDADRRPQNRPTHVSLQVKASDEADARPRVRAALRGLMELDRDPLVEWLLHARLVKR
jgi:hypothetical protein